MSTGRKPVIIIGTIIFLTDRSPVRLRLVDGLDDAFRLLQGIGAGSMQPIAVTIAGDYYVGRERLRMQGALSSVWAAAAMVGPLVGGLLVEHLSWSWIFWVNVPIGILTIAAFVVFMHEDVAHREHRNRLSRRGVVLGRHGRVPGRADAERDTELDGDPSARFVSRC